MIINAVDRWLELGRVRPFCVLRGKTLTVRFGGGPGGGLFAALALQLLIAVTGTRGLAICTACTRPYAPKRRPNPNRRNYCQKCAHKTAVRDATRDWAIRKRRHSKTRTAEGLGL